MYIGLLHTHKLVVTLFLLIYLVKTILLLTGKEELLEKVTQKIKVPEMIISFLFLVTGIGMLFMIAEIKTLLIAKIVVVFASIPLAVIGFKKKNKVLAALSLVLIIGSYGMAEMSKKVKRKELASSDVITDPKAANYDQVAHGKLVFDSNCTSCHGADGAKMASGAKNLQVSQLSEEETLNIINYGKNNMMKYEGILTEDEIEAVTRYVITLRK